MYQMRDSQRRLEVSIAPTDSARAPTMRIESTTRSWRSREGYLSRMNLVQQASRRQLANPRLSRLYSMPRRDPSFARTSLTTSSGATSESVLQMGREVQGRTARRGGSDSEIMRLYLDDDTAWPLLAKLFRIGGPSPPTPLPAQVVFAKIM